MMKKITFKGLKLSSQRRQRSQSSKGEHPTPSPEKSVSLSADVESDSQVLSHHYYYADECSAMDDRNHRRKEKYGIFRSLRRKLTSSVHRKYDDVESTNHIEESSQSAFQIRTDTKKTKQKRKCCVPMCEKKSNSSSQSCDSLELNILAHTPRKITELHSNIDANNVDSRKEKASCKTKDILHFQYPDRKKGDRGGPRECDQLTDSSLLRGKQHLNSINNRHHTTSACQTNLDRIRNSETNDLKLVERLDAEKEQEKPWDFVKEPPKLWSLTQELFRLSKFGWYWGPITRYEAEEKLAHQPDGAFLVRDSSDERYLLSLSFRSYGRTLHTRIEHCNGMFSLDTCDVDTEGYPSIVDLIEHSMNDSQAGIFSYSRSRLPGAPSFPVRLTKPMSRFTQVRSLQYLCRFVIRQYTRLDHIQQLPLPNRIKGWIEENQY